MPQTNTLIEACYRLTLEEKRLLLAAISTLDPRLPIPKEITVTAADYASIYGLKIQAGYQQLKDASDKLYEQDIRFKTGGYVGRQRWLDRIIYRKGKGDVKLSFSVHLHAHLSELTGNFTSYTLANIKPFKSIYSIRLFELISQYRSKASRFISITDFRDMLDLNEKYPLYADLRKSVIEPSVKEINQKSNLELSFSPEKQGRKIIKLWF